MKSAQVTVVREMHRVVKPVGVLCVLCKLHAGDHQDGVVFFEVRYNGSDRLPENPLCALTRHKYVCDDCVTALREDP